MQDRHTAGGEPFHVVAGRALIAFRELRRAEGRLARYQGACLVRLLARQFHLRAGYARFTDFTREVLQQASRTTKRRLSLHRTLDGSPPLAQAFDAGRLTACKVLALRPLAAQASLPFWIELAETLPVRELSRQVRAAVDSVGEAAKEPVNPAREAVRLEDTAEEPGVRVTFAAPMAAAVAWDQSLDLARRVLGWEAPAHVCVEAILAEATAELAAGSEAPDVPGGGQPASAPEVPGDGCGSETDSSAPPATWPDRPVPRRARPRPAAVRALGRVITETHAALDRIGDAAPPSPAEEPAALIRQARDFDLVERPLRVLQGRLLLAMMQADAVTALGYDTLAAFAEDALGMAPRSARRLLGQAFLLEDHPQLARAYADGRIGAGKAFLVNRIALSASLPAFLHRAEGVTHLALEREVRFLERLREILPTVARRFRGPLPMPGLEPALCEALAERGWEADTVRAHLREQGVEVSSADGLSDSQKTATSEHEAPMQAEDTAQNPAALRRLESLLEFVVLADEAHDAGIAGTDSSDAPGPMLAPDPRTTTVTFWAPRTLYRHWCRAITTVQERCGVLPTWVAVTWILEIAVREWERVDPRGKPTEHAILERDDFRCQAPGCSARRGLEVHHIRFRSHGGSDAGSNLITLCSAHHRHVIHPGWLSVAGEAPGALKWRRSVSSIVDTPPRNHTPHARPSAVADSNTVTCPDGMFQDPPGGPRP